jgi:RND family efflux transporter MFP subunit
MSRTLSLSLPAAMLVTTVILAGCKPSETAAQDPRTSDPLVAVTTVGSPSVATETYTGSVGARVESDLGFRVQGKVLARLVDAGQVVRKGQPLMRIDPTDYAHGIVVQIGNVAAARAKWIQASADEKRYRSLVGTGATSQSAYDQAKAGADSAKALLDAALAQEKIARDQQDYAELLADSDGTVVETFAEPGQVVAQGQVVVRLAHAGPREAVVDLPETVRPALGSLATASLFGGTVQGGARLRQLSDSANPRTRTFEARYVLEGASAGAPLGATVTIGLKNDRAAGTMSVPLGALDDEGSGPGVWVVDRQTARVSYRPVRVASLGGESVAVSSGLSAGETIVATGGHYLHEGEQVRLATIQAAMQ